MGEGWEGPDRRIEISNAELSRGLTRLEAQIKDSGRAIDDSIKRVHERLDPLTGLPDRFAKLEESVKTLTDSNLIERVKETEDTLRWLSRLIIGAVLLGLVGLLVKGQLG